MSSVSVPEAWAFGPQPGAKRRLGWRPFGLAAGVVAAIGAAAVIGFVAFVNVAGREDAATGVPPARTTTGTAESAEAPASIPISITDIRLTDAVDAVTGQPASSTSVFAVGEPVRLWLSFEAGDDAVPLTALWFRGNNKVARLTAPLPDAASQMVFPLPELAADRPGPYRVEVRSGGDLLATESFEVTDG